MPGERIYVVVLANSDAPKASPGYLAKRMTAIALGTPFPERTSITVDPAVLARYVGIYEGPKGVRRTVTAEGGKLYTERAGGQRLEARPFSPTEFFSENSLTHGRFEVGADGAVTAMLMHQDGADTPERATRVADAPASPQTARVEPRENESLN